MSRFGGNPSNQPPPGSDVENGLASENEKLLAGARAGDHSYPTQYPTQYPAQYPTQPYGSPTASANSHYYQYQYQSPPPVFSQYQPGSTGYPLIPPQNDAAFEREVRLGFTRKVFGLLATQLAVTAIISSLFVISKPVQSYVFANPWTLWTSMGLSFALMLVLVCSESLRRTHPINLIFLFLFTAAESVLIGTVSATVQTDILLMAFGITAAVVLALTFYAMQTKWDFTTSGGIMFSMLLGLVFAVIVGTFVRSSVLNIVIAAAGAIIFSAYIVFDVQLVVGGNHMYKLSPDEYVVAALNIYLDIINLFLYILQLLQQIRGD